MSCTNGNATCIPIGLCGEDGATGPAGPAGADGASSVSDITYDGLGITCGNNSGDDIITGDSLETALLKIMSNLCSNAQDPIILVSSTPVAIAATGIITTSIITIPTTGYYNVRWSVGLDTQVITLGESTYASFKLSTNSTGSFPGANSRQIKFKRDGNGIGPALDAQYGSAETIVQFTAGDTVEIECYYFLDTAFGTTYLTYDLLVDKILT